MGGERGHSTAIYYLLEKGQRSHWHRVKDAAEAWHYYAGAPLALYRSDDGEKVETILLGSEVTSGNVPRQSSPPIAGRRRKVR